MIVVPALHPAHDVIVRVDVLEPGVVLRVGMEAMLTGVGGKAVNGWRFWSLEDGTQPAANATPAKTPSQARQTDIRTR